MEINIEKDVEFSLVLVVGSHSALEGGGNPTSKDGSSLKRSFVTFDRGGQTGPPRSNDFFFGAVDDTGAANERPSGHIK